MIVVTGSSGFIGKNLVKKLLVKYPNDTIKGVDFSRNVEIETFKPYEFLSHLKKESFSSKIKVIFHNGACSSTTNNDVPYMMKNNLDYSLQLFNLCLEKGINIIYASSASVYGDGPFNEESPSKPKNLYASTKSIFDDYVKNYINSENRTQIVGLRYFNVYGPNEQHKGDMSSVVYKFYNQKNSGKINLFEGSDSFKRDFVYVDDIVDINLFFYENSKLSGIYNAGSGMLNSFLDIANIFARRYSIEINEIKMPDNLVGKYQKYTLSDNSNISKIYKKDRTSLQDGVNKYLEILENENRIH